MVNNLWCMSAIVPLKTFQACNFLRAVTVLPVPQFPMKSPPFTFRNSILIRNSILLHTRAPMAWLLCWQHSLCIRVSWDALGLKPGTMSLYSTALNSIYHSHLTYLLLYFHKYSKLCYNGPLNSVKTETLRVFSVLAILRNSNKYILIWNFIWKNNFEINQLLMSRVFYTKNQSSNYDIQQTKKSNL